MKRCILIGCLCALGLFATAERPDHYWEQPPVPENFDLENEDVAYLETHLDAIFPDGHDALSAEQKAIDIMRYTVSYLRLKSNSGTATKVLQDQHAICGGMATVFIKLCRLAGIPARYIGNFYLPYMAGHAIAEVYYDEKWHFFDPTFGIFFYPNDVYDGRSEIPNYNAITAYPHLFTMLKVVDTPWVGEFNDEIRGFGVVKAEPDYLKSTYKIPLQELYAVNGDRNFPIAYGVERAVSAPVVVDLRETTSVMVGEKDGSNRDINFKPRWVGSPYIMEGLGGICAPPMYHTWFVKVKDGSYLRLNYTILSRRGVLHIQPLRGVIVGEYQTTDDAFTAILRANDDEIAFKVYTDLGNLRFDCMELEYITLPQEEPSPGQDL